MRGVRFIALALSTAALVVGACGIYDTSLLLPAPADSGSPVVEAGGPSDAGADADTCMHVGPPAPPMKDDGTEDLDIVFAGSDVRMSRSGSATIPAPPTGVDLDGLCTCPQREACTPLTNMKHCDTDGGADDGIGTMFDTFSALAPDLFSDKALAAPGKAGNRNVLFRVKSWNGSKNDTQVTFIAYGSNGLAVHQEVDGAAITPKNDGTDVWLIDPASLLGGGGLEAGVSCEGMDSECVPLFADTAAYVSNGVLVAHMDFPLAFGAGDSTLVIKLHRSLITATLTREADGGVHVDDGQVVGRWATSALLTAMSALPDPLVLGAHLCGDAGTYVNLKQVICAQADLESDPANDGTTKPCDALSAAIGFAAVQARLGYVLAVPPDTSACGPDYMDDCNR